MVQRLERRKEALLRENEKLKNDNRNIRKNALSSNTSGYMSSSIMGGRSTYGQLKDSKAGITTSIEGAGGLSAGTQKFTSFSKFIGDGGKYGGKATPSTSSLSDKKSSQTT